MVNFGPLAAEIGPVVWAPQLISTGFASWQRYCTALQQWTSAKLFTLGIGPHSIFSFFPSPNLSGRRLDVYHTSTHGVALVRI